MGLKNFETLYDVKVFINNLFYLRYGQEKVSECFSCIQTTIIRALQSVQKVIINDKHCFELYGFDILFDSTLKPWILEVNARYLI